METTKNTLCISEKKHREFDHFTLEDRREIAQCLQEKMSYRRIGIRLGCHHTSVGREVRAHRSRNGTYDADKADHKACVSRRNSKYQGMKVENHSELKSYVIEKLIEGYAPDTIAGRIKTYDTNIPYASHNALYAWLYSVWGRMYCPLLHTKQTSSKKQKKNKTERVMIPNRTSIHKRPQSVDDRKELGHTESDTIVSGKKTKSTVALSVMVERSTCLTTLELIATTSPRLNNEARYTMVKRMPCKILTDTDDNGIENKEHEAFTQVTNIPVYFCDSHCSWQKGLVENINKRIRFKIPKGSDIGLFSKEDIQTIEYWLNNIPRKSLGYMTPTEKMQELLAIQKETEMIQKKKS